MTNLTLQSAQYFLVGITLIKIILARENILVNYFIGRD